MTPNRLPACCSSKYGFEVTTLLNRDATRDKILGAITHFRKSLAENDSFLIYYAGHGSYDRTTDKGYWLPVDADSDPLITSRDISADDLITEVRGLAARHVIIISDSCFSGDLSRDAGDISPSDGNQAYIHRMQRAPSRTLMASGSDEPVSDSGSQGHSVFAALLFQACNRTAVEPLRQTTCSFPFGNVCSRGRDKVHSTHPARLHTAIGQPGHW